MEPYGFALDIHADAFSASECYRFYYLRKTQMILVYKGDTLDTLSSHEKIRHIRKEDFIDTIENYLKGR